MTKHKKVGTVLHGREADIERQANTYRRLAEMKSGLYRDIDEQVDNVTTVLCPDLHNKPLYELEKLPFKIDLGLRNLEKTTGVSPTVVNLANYDQEELLKQLRVPYFGKGTLKQLYSILKRYGIDKA